MIPFATKRPHEPYLGQVESVLLPELHIVRQTAGKDGIPAFLRRA
jgi:hypothetical protein